MGVSSDEAASLLEVEAAAPTDQIREVAAVRLDRTPGLRRTRGFIVGFVIVVFVVIAFVASSKFTKRLLYGLHQSGIIQYSEDCWMSCPAGPCKFDVSNTDSLVGTPPAVGSLLGFEQMPAKPLNWGQLRTELKDVFGYRGYSFGYVPNDRAPHMLYEATRVPGIWENVPEPMRGVFWMNGNPAQEVLAVLQYGLWYPEHKTLVSQYVPFSWGFFGGPKGCYGGFLTCITYMFGPGGKHQATRQSYGDGDTPVNYSYGIEFEPCPSKRSCHEGSSNLTYSRIQIKGGADLHSNVGGADVWTIEEMDGVKSGSLWYRGVYGNCGESWHGGYHLTKIIDSDGSRIEPYWSEYRKFMDGEDIIVWSSY